MAIYRNRFYEKKPKTDSETQFYAMVAEMYQVPYGELTNGPSRTGKRPLGRRSRKFA